jgi:hypothetical protein
MAAPLRARAFAELPERAADRGARLPHLVTAPDYGIHGDARSRGSGVGAGAPGSELSGLAVTARQPENNALIVGPGSMSDCAECHIGGPDLLPDDPFCGIGSRDDLITAFVDGDMIDVAVGV